MHAFADMFRFLDTGGPVLWPIGITAVVLGALIIERYWYFRRDFPRQAAQGITLWNRRSDKKSRQALRLREALISDARVRLGQTMPIIRMLVTLCPMLGLLGTVTGMMSVFDVIGMLGTGNARAMSAGIYKATIPTMAGMVVALPGLYFRVALQREVNRRVEKLTDRLALS